MVADLSPALQVLTEPSWVGYTGKRNAIEGPLELLEANAEALLEHFVPRTLRSYLRPYAHQYAAYASDETAQPAKDRRQSHLPTGTCVGLAHPHTHRADELLQSQVQGLSNGNRQT